MKVKSLLIALFLLAGTVTTFARRNVKGKEVNYSPKTKTAQVAETKKSEDVVQSTCKVTVEYGKTSVSITVTCECTQKESCDAAYKIATIALQ